MASLGARGGGIIGLWNAFLKVQIRENDKHCHSYKKDVYHRLPSTKLFLQTSFTDYTSLFIRIVFVIVARWHKFWITTTPWKLREFEEEPRTSFPTATTVFLFIYVEYQSWLMNLRSMCSSGQIKAFIYRNYCAKGFFSKINIREGNYI